MNAVAYAASQFSTTCEIVAVGPRSTCSHCGSAAAWTSGCRVLPSNAAEAGVPPFSSDEDSAVLPCERRVSAAEAEKVVVTAYVATIRMAATDAKIRFRRRRCAGRAAVSINCSRFQGGRQPAAPPWDTVVRCPAIRGV